MITLLALALRLALLAAFTFGFVVLFEHGSENFSAGAETEWDALRTFVKGNKPAPDPSPAPTPLSESTPTTSPTPTPVPDATPTPTPVPATASQKPPGAWEALQKRPIGEGINIPVAGKAGDPPAKSRTNP